MNTILDSARSSISKKDVFRLIRKHGPMERAAMSREMGVSFPTISRFINELLGDRLIQEGTLGESTGGRKPVTYSVNGSAYSAYGVTISRDIMQVALIDLGAQVLELEAFKMDETAGPEQAVRQIHQAVHRMGEMHKGVGGRIMGICIAANGPLDGQNGIIFNPSRYPAGWRYTPNVEMLKRGTDLPVLLENQSRAGALAEQWYGAARNLDSLVFILADYGIGAGIFANGSLIRCDVDVTASLGNMVISFERALENKSEGRLEDYSSIYAMCRRVEEELRRGRKSSSDDFFRNDNPGLSFDRILEGYRQADSLCKKVVEDAARAFGIALANFTSLMRPGKVILGGETVEKCEDFFRLAVETAEEHIYPKSRNRIDIVHAALGSQSILVGAAVQVFQAFLY